MDLTYTHRVHQETNACGRSKGTLLYAVNVLVAFLAAVELNSQKQAIRNQPFEDGHPTLYDITYNTFVYIHTY